MIRISAKITAIGLLAGAAVSVTVMAGSGDPYTTAAAARWAALEEEGQRTRTDGDGVTEYGAAVYRTSDGNFTYGPLVSGGHTSIDIPVDHNIGTLDSLTHSHPEDAVEGDLSGDVASVPYYAVEQDGDIYKRDPRGATFLVYSSPVDDPFGT